MRPTKVFLPLLTLSLTLLFWTTTASAEPSTLVYLNGTPSPVYFNDGDTIRVLSGKYAGVKGRLAGFNTLESYGPVHRWGTWTTKELYVLAKMGTLNARRGTWHCTSDLKTDTYGRTLWWCPDLGKDQIAKGLAHVLTVSDDPGDPELIKAQREAQKKGLGIWAKGIPEYILTSNHAISERPGESTAGNRLVSPVDGHSMMWIHSEDYPECFDVCWKPVPAEQRQRLLARLRKHPAIAALQGAYADEKLDALTTQFEKDGTLGEVGLTGLNEEGHRAPITAALTDLRDQGWLAAAKSDLETCMLYVDFRRRFGAKASCLK